MPNPSFTKFQKERKRQERAAAKRRQRDDRRKTSSEAPRGAGPPIDYEARVGADFTAPPDEQEEPGE